MPKGTCRRCKRTDVYLPSGSTLCEDCTRAARIAARRAAQQKRGDDG